MAMLVLGGMFSVTGALLGTVIVTVLSEVLRWLGDGPQIGSVKLPMIVGLSSMAYGAIVVIMMVWRTGGILGDKEIDGAWDHLRRWVRRAPAAEPVLEAPAIVAATGAPAERRGRRGARRRPPQPVAKKEPVLATRATASAAASAEPLLVVDEVSMVFAGLRAVDNASIEVYPGEILGLIGPNGAGKTTLLNMISGLYTATSGDHHLQRHPGGDTCPRTTSPGWAWAAPSRTPTSSANSPCARTWRRPRGWPSSTGRPSTGPPRSSSTSSACRACRASGPAPCPTAFSARWRWPAPSPWAPTCSCSTSRPPAPTRWNPPA